MSKFDSYFLMNLEDAKEYACEKVTRFDWDKATMESKEIGDGNLNYVLSNRQENLCVFLLKCTFRQTATGLNLKF